MISAEGRKGDAALLHGKQSAGFKTAEEYLGIKERQRQYLVKQGNPGRRRQGVEPQNQR
jgi:hypothetical protein